MEYIQEHGWSLQTNLYLNLANPRKNLAPGSYNATNNTTTAFLKAVTPWYIFSLAPKVHYCFFSLLTFKQRTDPTPMLCVDPDSTVVTKPLHSCWTYNTAPGNFSHFFFKVSPFFSTDSDLAKEEVTQGPKKVVKAIHAQQRVSSLPFLIFITFSFPPAL
jgi:hypothetical protein